MPPKPHEERTYTAGQLARMLGCSLRSIYRWEEAGVIPRATRVERGKVSARIYTASQVEKIRSSVQARLNFESLFPKQDLVWDSGSGKLVPGPKREPPRRSIRDEAARILEEKALMRPFSDALRETFPFRNIYFPHVSALLFIRAMRFAQKVGCDTITITAPGGKSQTFSLSRKRQSGKRGS
jgi:hypothetical protein